jgi:hypothetical protein
VVDVVGIFTEISAVQNLTDAGLLGNLAGDIAQNNSTRQVSLNADLLDGFHASSFASAVHNHDASNIVSGTLNVARYSAYSDLSNEGYLANAAGDIARNNGALQVTLNADLLDGLSESAFVRVTGDTMTGPLFVDTPTSYYAVFGKGSYMPGIFEHSSGNSAAYIGMESYALRGWTDTPAGYGLYAYSVDGTGAYAYGGGGYGVYGYGTTGVYGYSASSNGIGAYGYSNAAGGRGVYAYAAASDGIGLYARGGSSGWAGDFRGKVRISSLSTGATVMELGEGLDYAEGFDLSDPDRVEPGAVLVIDQHNPGKLRLSDTPYDIKVAGIVAGANGLGSGVRLGAGGFDHDVALAGRVYCNVDATEEAVEAGDLLTTSSLPGHAMKVSDHARAQGAILGKAMTGLGKGSKGQILVLVTLQ